jgi:hypothetical protein
MFIVLMIPFSSAVQCNNLPPPPVDGKAVMLNSGSRYGEVCPGSNVTTVVSPTTCPNVTVKTTSNATTGFAKFRLTISAVDNPSYWNAIVIKFSSTPTNVDVSF